MPGNHQPLCAGPAAKIDDRRHFFGCELEANGVIEKTSCLGVDLEKRFRRRNAEFVVADLLVNVRLAVYEDESRKGTVRRGTRVLGDLVVDGNELIILPTGLASK